ncbi:MAG: hypothetical protein QNI99_02020 [Woeseiaceae bacterium]|nr:hypothetical protein [Woeseiaceae bacterium]
MNATGTRIVDNRVFLLGLDALYRAALKPHEQGELRHAAQCVAHDLRVGPADVPVEGYYAEDPRLTEYFRLIRALQGVPEDRRCDIKHAKAYLRLKTVSEAPIFGNPAQSGYVLERCRDPLYLALEAAPEFEVKALTRSAHKIATESDCISLGGLAAIANDSVVLASLTASATLYTLPSVLSVPDHLRRVSFAWTVDSELEQRARHFVNTFNELFGESLPVPNKQNARLFWEACDLDSVAGRCVRLAVNDSQKRSRHYHWAVDPGSTQLLTIRDFWAPEIWTTERYRAESKVELLPLLTS